MNSSQISILLCVATTWSEAATVSFSPGQLSDFQTSGSLVYHQPNTSSATSSLTAIAPNVFRLETVISAPNHQAIYFHSWHGATLTPDSDTSIASVDFSIEMRQQDSATAFTPIYLTLEQAGEVYFYTANSIVPRFFRPDENSSNFILRNQATNLTYENFARFDNGGLTSIDSSSHPDFSESGQEIQWGISTLSGTGNINLQRIVDFRNARLTITTIPEPDSLLVITFFSLGTLIRHRKCQAARQTDITCL